MNVRRAHEQHGFTLIEAIVALVLIATTGMALFSWINSNLMTLSRVQEVNAENSATQNVLEYMADINPMASPEGRADLGSLRLSWQAEATTEPRDGASYPYGTSLYQLAMYRTKISVQKPDGQSWFAFSLQQVGYKKVREIVKPF
ncbi:MAG TPA: prepilin-type N-terminal cleavage/methylation domain-containing protein [Burkholderiales bacterium]|nr:prepilin-type N-terminal cleavage/methylation domain-containing protein [Burkholderiales bacterium]